MEKHSFILLGDTIMSVKYNNTSSNVIIDEPAHHIGEMAFYADNHISSVVLPETIKTVGKGAFCDCHHLISAELNDGLEEIGENAFVRTMLLGITIPDSVVELGLGAFVENKWMTTVILPAKLYYKISMNFYDYFPRSINSITIHNTGISKEDKPEYERISMSNVKG